MRIYFFNFIFICISKIILELNIFHFEISGKEIKEEQLQNIEFKEKILFTFHLEILGNSFNDKQSLNNADK